MKITICGSIAFFDEMDKISKELKELGHQVKLPPYEIEDADGNLIPVKEYYSRRKTETNDDSWIWNRKEEAMREHFNKIEWCDVILVLNYTKNNIENYVGANTLLEMGLSFHLNKPIFLLNNIPEISYKEEILGMKPILINGDLNLIK